LQKIEGNLVIFKASTLNGGVTLQKIRSLIYKIEIFFFFNSFFGGERGDCKIDGSSEGLSEIFPKKEKSVFDFYEKRLAVNNWLSIIV
jgi:hypothetical protein